MVSNGRGLSLDDFWRLKAVSDVQVSPDGTAAAYVVETLDEATNSAHSAIWMWRLAGGVTRPFSADVGDSFQPRWSPDGERLAFVSTRHEGKPQVFVVTVHGGEAQRLTSADRGAHSPTWSPDGVRLCFSADMASDRQGVPQEKQWLEAHTEANAQDRGLRAQRSLMSRVDGRGYIDRRLHLWIVDTEGPNEPRQLTEGDFDAAGATWAPHGALIAFAASHSDHQEHTLGSDIWTVDADTGDLQRLTDGTLSAEPASWSPDGQTLAFYASPNWSEFGYHDAHLWTVTLQGGQRDLSGTLDLGHRHVQPDFAFPATAAPHWSADGAAIYCTLINHGDDVVYAADPDTGHISRVSEAGTDIYGMQLTPDPDVLLLLACRPDHPFDLFSLRISTGVSEPVMSTNHDLLGDLTLIQPQRVTCTGPRGWEIDGWLYLPPSETPPPCILHVHGGPYGAWGNSFYAQAQILATQGFASFYVNPRGSLGQGQEFSRAADWGHDDFRDLMIALDTVVERGLVDGDRVGITGISYGGFMTDWALGHTDRFRAGVAVNGVSNQVSMFGVSDASLWLPWEFGGPFWESDEVRQRWWDHSPLAFVDRIQAPLLLLQSENDYRCPIDQGEQMLHALRYLRRTVELVRFPGCSHVIAESGTPLQRWLQWKLTLDWFDQYVRPTRDAATMVPEEGGALLATADITP